ncbi:MAG TPA: M6 family metalloprotease domain-containing protein [Verrucomicrobiales bacterium]|nr:M6 family metalloprotease domain-containing protein [Verrucomicrobiales bacterium]
MASPFIGKVFTFEQPDGTPFEVRGWGDQHYAVFETLDGYTVVRNPASGFYEVAHVSGDGTRLEPAPGPRGNLDGGRAAVVPGVRIERAAARAQGMAGVLRMGGRRCDQRREQRKNLARAARILGGPVMAPPRRATVGDFLGLCLLIEFPDEPGAIPRDEVERFCNEPGYGGFGNSGSVSDYFRANSLDRCRYTNIVSGYYRAAQPKAHYTDPAIPQGVRARQLIVEALTHLKANHFDFTPLTVDNEGFVYAMNVYYAGEVVNNWAEGLWPHAWHLGTPFALGPGQFAYDYQFTDMSQQLTLGTFCHENGHMLCDYPDLYDYGGESSGVGAFCLMCAGGNINERNPVHISAYLKRLSGWAGSVTPVAHNGEIVLRAAENEFALFAKNSAEYFLIENRVRSGWDASLPGEGLAVWHVDEEGDNSDEQMTPAQHYELSLEQADGEFRLERTRQLGDAGDLFGAVRKEFSDLTTPHSKWWDGTVSNLHLLDISNPGPAMTFKTKLFRDDAGVQALQGESAPGASIPDNNVDGIFDVISIDEDAIIAGVKITLDIAHTYQGDLRVTLHAPWGEAILLHDRQGGGADNIQRTIAEPDLPSLANLHGRSTEGDWRLQVQDLAPADSGTLNRWVLEFTAAALPQGPVLLEEAPGAHIPDNDPAGIQRVLSTQVLGTAGSVEISVDITHTWIGDLRISLRSPVGTEVILHDRSGGNAGNVVKTYTAATTPSLGNLAGQAIAGDWRLHVSDHAAQDQGKLNSWRVVIHPVD